MKNVIIFIIFACVIALIYLKRTDVKKIVVSTMEKLTRNQFIELYGMIAKKAGKDTGLFPSLFLAQAILESANGNSSLSKEAYNFFGIKADKSWNGEYVVKPTREVINGKDVMVNAKFRKYSTPLYSFLDRVDFLRRNTRYGRAGVFVAKTPEEQAQALQRAGYATDPKYSELLINLINSNNLKRFDA